MTVCADGLIGAAAGDPRDTVTVEAGDMVGASPPASALLRDKPTLDALNKMGIDVGTLGNHEFDRGVAEMLRQINGGTFTIDTSITFDKLNFPVVDAGGKARPGGAVDRRRRGDGDQPGHPADRRQRGGAGAVAARGRCHGPGESPAGDLIADSERVYAKAQLAFVNTGSVRAGLPPGPVTYGELFTMQPFQDDYVDTFTLTGAQVWALLQQQLAPGTGGIMQISGLHFTYSGTQITGAWLGRPARAGPAFHPAPVSG